MLYSIVLVSTKHQHESAIGLPMFLDLFSKKEEFCFASLNVGIFCNKIRILNIGEIVSQVENAPVISMR